MARSIEISRLFYSLEAETKGLEGDLKRAETSLGKTADFVRAHPAAALGGLAAAALAAGLKLTAMAADFDRAMREIGTLVDKTAVDMDALADGVLGLFASLPVQSIDDLTKGLYNIISAGVPAGEAIDFLRTAAEASVGGVTDVNTAVDGLTTAVNAFSTQGVTAADAADAFFVAVKAGKTTFGELSSAIGNTAGLANSLGVTLDDLLANTAALTLGGLRTSEAMNALRQVFSNLAKPTAEIQKAYPELVAQFDLAALKSKGLTGFMVELAASLKGNQDAAIKMFGSVEGLNAVLTLTADGGARIKRIMGEMEGKTGAATAAFHEMELAAVNVEQALKNRLTAQLIRLGEVLIPAKVGLLNFFSEVLGAALGGPVVDAALAVGRLSQSMDDLGDRAEKAKALETLRSQLSLLSTAGRFTAASFERMSELIEQGINTKTISANLVTIETGLRAAQASGLLTEEQLLAVSSALGAVRTKMAETTPTVNDLTLATAEAGVKIEGLTKAQRAAVQASTDLDQAQKDGILSATKLTDVQKDLVEKALKEMGKRSAEAAKELKALREEIEATFVASTTTLIDDTALAIARFEEKAKKLKLPKAEVDAFTKGLRDQGSVLESLRLSAGRAATALADPKPAIALLDLNGALDQTRDLLATLEPGTEPYAQALERLSELTEAQRKLLVKVKEGERDAAQAARDRYDDAFAAHVDEILQSDLSREAKAELLAEVLNISEAEAGVLLTQKGQVTKTEELLQKVAAVATGVLGLATAFGIVDDEAANVLNHVINIGANISKAFGGDPAAIVAVLGSITGVLGSIFGDSPADQERKRILKENTARLEELTEVTGDLVGAQSSGQNFAGVGAAIAARGGPGLGNGPVGEVGIEVIRSELLKRGLTFRDLDQVAADLGITIRDKDGRLLASGLRLLLQAINSADTGLPDNFRARKRNVDDEIAIGVRGADTRFGGLLEAGGTDNAISRAISGIDVSTDAGRAQATSILQQLFQDLNAGKLTTGDLGNLSRDDFSDLLQDLLGILLSDKAIAGPGNQGSTDPVDVGDDIATSFSTALDETLGEGSPAVDYLAEIARNTAAFQPVAAPNLPPGLIGGATGSPNITITFGPTSVTVGAGAVADPDAIASAVDAALSDRAQQLVDELMGQAILDAERPSARRRVS